MIDEIIKKIFCKYLPTHPFITWMYTMLFQLTISLNFPTSNITLPSSFDWRKSLFTSSLFSGHGTDYLNLALRDGGVSLTMGLANGKQEMHIKPARVRFDDHQWHKVTVHRRIQEVRVCYELHAVLPHSFVVFIFTVNFTMVQSIFCTKTVVSQNALHNGSFSTVFWTCWCEEFLPFFLFGLNGNIKNNFVYWT